jgi:hypothetical protein
MSDNNNKKGLEEQEEEEEKTRTLLEQCLCLEITLVYLKT